MRREQLLYLIELDKCHSIHAASDKLHISSQALGASIRALEKELGLTMLIRSRTGVRLTSNAQAVIRLGRSFWSGIDQLIDKTTSSFNCGTLELYATYGCMHCFIPQMIKELSEYYPSLKLDIHEMSEEKIIDELKAKAIPYALTIRCYLEDLPYKTLDDGLRFVPFSIGRMYAMVPNKSPLADYRQVSIKTLLKWPLLFYSPCPIADNSTYPLLKYYGQPKQYEIQYNHIVYKAQLVTGEKIGFSFTTPFQDSQYYKGFLRNVPLKENIYMYAGYLTLKDTDTTEINRLLTELNLYPLVPEGWPN